MLTEKQSGVKREGMKKDEKMILWRSKKIMKHTTENGTNEQRKMKRIRFINA